MVQGGKLKSSGANLLPRTSENCFTRGETCFKSGDPRVNVNPFSSMLHLVFMRSHNGLATKLKAINPDWTDQKLFDVAKKINGAVYQKIIYEEWLPLVLGQKMANDILKSSEEAEIIPGVSNEFATAGIRFYNSMMPGDIRNQSVLHAKQKLFDLKDTFYRPQPNTESTHFLLDTLTSALKQRAMAMDSSYVDDVSNRISSDYGLS